MRLFKILIIVLFSFSCSNLQVKKQDVEIDQKDFDLPLTKNKASAKEDLNVKDYAAYIIDPLNGLIANKQVGNFDFSVFYKPNSFVAINNLGIDGLSQEKYDLEMGELKDLQYFSFKITAKDFKGELLKYKLKTMEEYEWRVNYFSFKMQNDIKLIEGKDTLDCVLFHFERNYGIAPNLNFMFGFPKTNNEYLIYNKTISVNDIVFETGKINITIAKENIIDIPGVKIN